MPRPSNCSAHSAGSRCHTRPVVNTSALQAISRDAAVRTRHLEVLEGPSMLQRFDVDRREHLDVEARRLRQRAPREVGVRRRPTGTRDSSRCGSTCRPVRPALRDRAGSSAVLPTRRRPPRPGPRVRRRRWRRRRPCSVASVFRPDLRANSPIDGVGEPLAVRQDHERQRGCRRPAPRLSCRARPAPRCRRTRTARDCARGSPSPGARRA